MSAKVKVTMYLPEEVVTQARNEAMRQDRSISWVIERAWRMSCGTLAKVPSVDQLVKTALGILDE